MKVKKLLKKLDPCTKVIIRESNGHKLEQASTSVILSYYPKHYGTWFRLNKKIGRVRVKDGWLVIDIREEKKDDETN